MLNITWNIPKESERVDIANIFNIIINTLSIETFFYFLSAPRHYLKSNVNLSTLRFYSISNENIGVLYFQNAL